MENQKKIEENLRFLDRNNEFYHFTLKSTILFQKALDIVSLVLFSLPIAFLCFRNVLPEDVQDFTYSIFLTISFAVSVLYPFLSEKNKIKRIQKTIIKHEHAIFLLKNLKANCHGSNDKLIDALREQYLILAGISYETKNPPMIASQFGVSLLR